MQVLVAARPERMENIENLLEQFLAYQSKMAKFHAELAESAEAWFDGLNRAQDDAHYRAGGGGYDTGYNGGGPSDRTGTKESENGQNLIERIKDEYGCEINEMKEFTEKNNRECGYSIIMNKKTNVILFVNWKEAEPGSYNVLPCEIPNVPDGYVYLGDIHTHIDDGKDNKDTFSSNDFDCYRFTLGSIIDYGKNEQKPTYSLNIMVSIKDNNLQYIYINNMSGYKDWAINNHMNGGVSAKNNFNYVMKTLSGVGWGYYRSENYNIRCTQPNWISPHPRKKR